MPLYLLSLSLLSHSETFQKRLSQSGLVEELLSLLEKKCFEDGSVFEMVCDVLMFPSCKSELFPQSADIPDKMFPATLLQSPLRALDALLQCRQIQSVSLDAFILTAQLIGSILQCEDLIVNEPHLLAILTFLTSSSRLSTSVGGNPLTSANPYPTGPSEVADISNDVDERQELDAALKAVISVLSQLSHDPDFVKRFGGLSLFVKTLLQHLRSPDSRMQICSLLMLGNMMQVSDWMAVQMVEGTDIVKQLVQLLIMTTNGSVLRTILEFTQTLAKLMGNRLLLGDADIMDAISRCWTQTVDVQLFELALFQTRHLLHQCPSNCLIFLERQREDSESLFRCLEITFSTLEDEGLRSQLGATAVAVWYNLLVAHNQESPQEGEIGTSTEPPRTSAAANNDGPSSTRLTTGPAAVDTLKAWPSDDSYSIRVEDIDMFLAVVTDSSVPSLTTKAWLTLALVSRHGHNADVLYRSLIVGNGLAAFRTTLTDTEGRKPNDRSNARYLLSELIKHSVRLWRACSSCSSDSAKTYAGHRNLSRTKDTAAVALDRRIGFYILKTKFNRYGMTRHYARH